MNKNTGMIVGIVALVVIVGGVYAFMDKNNDVMIETQTTDSAVMQNESDTTMPADEMKSDDMMKKDESSMMDAAIAEVDVMVKGSYESYSPEKIVRASTGDVVLFFHAGWCPSCRGLSSDIESKETSIPNGVSILKLDYDTETALKQKYGVTTQHTLVQVDKDGNLIKKWSGGSKLENLLAQIQ